MKYHRHKNKETTDLIVGDKIILNGQGKFPKKLIILEAERMREYKIVKTQYGKYHLNK